jgi:hypothetical protein
MGQMGFYDVAKRLEAISAKGDPLIRPALDWSIYRVEDQKSAGRLCGLSARGRCPAR